MTWTKDFAWDLGKATLTCRDQDARLIWEATNPWKLWIGENERTDFPYFHAEDWKLAIRYAEQEIRKNNEN